MLPKKIVCRRKKREREEEEYKRDNNEFLAYRRGNHNVKFKLHQIKRMKLLAVNFHNLIKPIMRYVNMCIAIKSEFSLF